MKKLEKYILEEINNIPDNIELNQDDLQSIYENIGRQILNNEILTEGLSDKFVNIFNNVKKNTNNAFDKGKEFLNDTSKACKNAIETIKKEAGDAWDKIKDTFEPFIAIIDKVLISSSKMITAISNLIDITPYEIENLIVSISCMLAQSNNKNFAKIWDLFTKIPKLQKQLMVLNMFLICAFFLNQYGIDTNIMSDIINFMQQLGKSEVNATFGSVGLGISDLS